MKAQIPPGRSRPPKLNKRRQGRGATNRGGTPHRPPHPQPPRGEGQHLRSASEAGKVLSWVMRTVMWTQDICIATRGIPLLCIPSLHPARRIGVLFLYIMPHREAIGAVRVVLCRL